MKASAEAKSPRQVRFARAQQPVLQGASVARASGRNLVFAYIGLWAALSDNVVTAYRQGMDLFANAQLRGARMEQALNRRLRRTGDDAGAGQDPAGEAGSEKIGHRRPGMAVHAADADDDLEQQVKEALANLGIPSRERLERLSQEIEALTVKIDEELRKSEGTAATNIAV
jgi:hypothetical protein